MLDSNRVLVWSAVNTCHDRALTWLVATLPAAPSQIRRRKSILLAWFVARGMARIRNQCPADEIPTSALQTVTHFGNGGIAMRTPMLPPGMSD